MVSILGVRRPRVTVYLAIACLVAIALGMARELASGRLAVAAVMAALAAAPLFAYVTLRWPLVFPYGIYALLVPIDAIVAINGGLTVTKLVGIVATGALVLRMVILRRVLAPPKSWTAWALVLGWMAMTTLWSVDQALTLQTVLNIASLFLVFTITSIYPVTRRELLVLAGAIVSAGAGLAVYAYTQYEAGAYASDSRLALGNGDYGVDPNHFAANFMLPLALATTGFIALKGRLTRLALAIATGLMGLGLVLTGSRGGLLSFAVMIAYITFRTRRWREAIIIAGMALAASIAFPKVYERFTDPSQANASGRFYIWEVAGPALANHMRWIYGSGLNAFQTVYNASLRDVYQRAFQGYDRVGHNILVQSSVELGIVGVVLIAYAWYQAWNAADVVPVGTPWFALRVASEATMIALLVTAFTIDLLWFKYFWLGLSLGPLVRNAYAPRSLSRGSAPSSRVARIVASSSSSFADFEHTSVAPEI